MLLLPCVQLSWLCSGGVLAPLVSQVDECRAVADELRAAFPDAEEPWLVDAALLRKQKKSIDEQLASLVVGVVGFLVVCNACGLYLTGTAIL